MCDQEGKAKIINSSGPSKIGDKFRNRAMGAILRKAYSTLTTQMRGLRRYQVVGGAKESKWAVAMDPLEELPPLNNEKAQFTGAVLRAGHTSSFFTKTWLIYDSPIHNLTSWKTFVWQLSVHTLDRLLATLVLLSWVGGSVHLHESWPANYPPLTSPNMPHIG